MLWGSFTAFLVDGKIRQAQIVAIIAAVMTAFGIIHDSALHWPQLDNPIVWGYVLLAVILWLAARQPLEREGSELMELDDMMPARDAPDAGDSASVRNS